MRISIYNKRIIYICIFLLVLLSCTSQRKEVNKMPKPTAIDLLLISRYDSIYTYPVKMKDEFKKAQKGLNRQHGILQIGSVRRIMLLSARKC